MLIRKVIKWAVLLLLLIAAVGGYAVLKTWKDRNALVLEGIRTEFAKKAPDWDVGVGDAKIVNLRGRVWLGEIVIKPLGRVRHQADPVRQEGHTRPRAGGRDTQGRAIGGRGDGDRNRLGPDRHSGAPRCRHGRQSIRSW